MWARNALAAVGGATGTLINLLVGFFVGLSSGATVIISQFFGGRRDGRNVTAAVHTAAALALGGRPRASSVLGLLYGPATLLRWLGAPEDDHWAHALDLHERLLLQASLASLIYNVGTGVLRAVGDMPAWPLYVLICLRALVNILLDLLLCAGAGHWGVARRGPGHRALPGGQRGAGGADPGTLQLRLPAGAAQASASTWTCWGALRALACPPGCNR